MPTSSRRSAKGHALRPNGSRCTTRCWRPAVCTSSAPSVTSRVASTTSCAAAPGRQGDAGSSRFYLSMDDPLLKIFAGDRLKAIMDRLKLPDGEADRGGHCQSLDRIARSARSRRATSTSASSCSSTTTSRTTSARSSTASATSCSSDRVTESRHQPAPWRVHESLFRALRARGRIEEQWDIAGAATRPRERLADSSLTRRRSRQGEPDARATARPVEEVLKAADATTRRRSTVVGVEAFAGFERSVMLQSIDQHWREHLSALDHLRQGIHLRGYAQKNPKQEYKRESFELFEPMLQRIRNDVTRVLVNVRIQSRGRSRAGRRTGRRARGQCVSSVRATPTPIRSVRRSADEDPESIALAVSRRRERARRRSSRCVVSARRSGATTRALAVRARSTSSATAVSAEGTGWSRQVFTGAPVRTTRPQAGRA